VKVETSALLNRRRLETGGSPRNNPRRPMIIMAELTIGEERFEQYLKAMQYPFEFEKAYPGKQKRPDFTVTKDGIVLLDVKDFDQNTPGGFMQFNPYNEIRRRIEYGRKKFKEYKEFCCCVVLQNNGNVFANTEDEKIVLGAMYGDWGYAIPINLGRAGAPDTPLPPPREVMLGGAQMHPDKNTTISALITLRHISIGRLRIRQIWDERPHLNINDAVAAASERFEGFDPEELQQGVIVWENAFARIPLSRNLFTGPFDLRWGIEGADQTIVFSGSGLL
jgi:hypothetical protein